MTVANEDILPGNRDGNISFNLPQVGRCFFNYRFCFQSSLPCAGHRAICLRHSLKILVTCHVKQLQFIMTTKLVSSLQRMTWFRLAQSIAIFDTTSPVKLSSLEKSSSFTALLNLSWLILWPNHSVVSISKNLQHQFWFRIHESISVENPCCSTRQII